MVSAITQHYDPDTIKIMQIALDAAWQSLSSRQRKPASKTRLARFILEAAAAGERNPARLRRQAVSKFIGL